MKLTKHEHACVVLEKDGGSIVIDPGVFSDKAGDIIADARAILITHEHFDHVNEAAINTALAQRPDLRVYAPGALADTFSAHAGQFTAVVKGDTFTAGGFSVSVHGDTHAVIHPDIPTCANVGYFVDEALYHPGDAYFVPEVKIETLLLPTSGPWMKLGEAADYVRAVKPARSVQIHEALLSEVALGMAGQMLGEQGLTGVPLAQVPVGDSITV